MFPRSPSLAVWLAILAVVGVFIFQTLPGPRPLDDAYITFRYARNIYQGDGFVYNPGERVQGTTTPLYTLLLVGLCVPFGPQALPQVSFGIALIADVINVWLFFRVARALLGERAAFVAALVFLFQPLRLNVAAGGMETSLFTLFLLGMYDQALVGRKIWWTAVFAALAVLTRPDAILAVGPVCVLLALQYRGKVVGPAILAAVLLAPWVVWAWLYFGSPLPHSILAKSIAYQDYSLLSSLYLLLTFLGTGTVGPYSNPILILLGLVAALVLAVLGLGWMLREQRPGLAVAGYPLLYYAAMTATHAPVFFPWYYIPLMPGLLILLFAGLRKLGRGLAARWTPPRRDGIIWALLGLAGCLLVLVPAGYLHWQPGWSFNRAPEANFHQATQQVRRQVRQGDWVMAPDIGVIGWELSQARILDPVGLVSPVSLWYMKDHTPWQTTVVQMTRDFKPAYIIASSASIQALLTDAQTRADYQQVWVTPPSSDSSSPVVILKRLGLY